MRRTGQWLRFVGRLIEMVGVVGVVLELGGRTIPQIAIPGGPTVSAAWLVVALGFTLWLVGTILLATARPEIRDGA